MKAGGSGGRGAGPWCGRAASREMAADAAMLRAVERGPADRVLYRAYEWPGAAVSLGRSNRVPARVLGSLARRGIGWARRPTGGGILVHGSDASFAVAVPRGHPAARGSPVERGRRLAAPVLNALRRMGFRARFRPPTRGRAEPQGPAPLCLLQESPLDILVGGRKVGAFAQRVTAGALFQHGSVMVGAIPAAVTESLRRAGIGSAAEWAKAGELAAALDASGATPPGRVRRAVLKEAARAFPDGVSGAGRGP